MDQSSFLNREMGLLAFNRRVLAQAEDPSYPLLERLRFLCIVSANLDEFFEVRVAWIKEDIRTHTARPSPDGLSPQQLFSRIAKQGHVLVKQQYKLLQEVLLPILAEEGIVFLSRTMWRNDQQQWIRDYFFRELMPVLTPIRLDPAHPFPRLLNKSLNFIVEISGCDAFGRMSGVAIVQAPRIFPRFIRLPADMTTTPDSFVFLSSIMHAHVEALFPGMQVKGCYQFRVTRDSDVNVDEETVKDLRSALQGELFQRQYGDAVRLEITSNCPEHLLNFLCQQFALQEEDVYCVDGPVNLVRLMQVPEQVDRPDLKFPPFMPGMPKVLNKRADMFAAIRGGDILLHHPFQSFTPVVELLRQAAHDPQVVAIKMTVYRTGVDSLLMEALIEAARCAKEVLVVVELMARFDEQANIDWAAKLERVGAHVVYGVYGYKTHAKMLLIIRHEQYQLRYYAHLGTGNYHANTAKIYTDLGLLTADQQVCAEINSVFMQLTGTGKPGPLLRLWQAPFSLHSGVLQAIEQEIEAASHGQRAEIIAKMNALLEPSIIQALYRASTAGVKIYLIIRGVCILRPGLAGLSENIRVFSVVGRFLEHSRVFYFYARGRRDVWLSSADWMGRNFFRRIEVAYLVNNAAAKQRVIREALHCYLTDNCHAWEMDANGDYHRRRPKHRRVRSAQLRLLAQLAAKSRD